MWVLPGRWRTDCGGCQHHKRWHADGKCTGHNVNPRLHENGPCRCAEFHLMVPDCMCGHSWEDHHHGCILNPNWPGESHDNGICRGVGAGECEATQFEGRYIGLMGGAMCACEGYRNCQTGNIPYDAKGLQDDA